MIAFEVIINGKKACTAGVRESGGVTSILTLANGNRAQLNPEEGNNTLIHLHVGGVISHPDESSQTVDWLNQALEVGDEIHIRIIETEDVDDSSRGKLLPLACSFCMKSHHDVAKLIAGPSVYVCNECVSFFLEQITNDGPKADGVAASGRCSFCGKASAEVTAMFFRDDMRICNQCLDICREILIDSQFSDVTDATPSNQ